MAKLALLDAFLCACACVCVCVSYVCAVLCGVGARELWEETGLGPAHCKFVPAPVTCTDAIGPDYHFVISQLLCFVDMQSTPSIAASDDEMDIAWLTADEILAGSKELTPKLTEVVTFGEKQLASNGIDDAQDVGIPLIPTVANR